MICSYDCGYTLVSYITLHAHLPYCLVIDLQLNVGHRVVLLKAASRIIKDTLDAMPVDMAKHMVKLASAEMTRSKVKLHE